jgi:hypothetical protein
MSCANYTYVEDEEEKRLRIIIRNGNSGEHYEEAHEDLLPSDGVKPC